MFFSFFISYYPVNNYFIIHTKMAEATREELVYKAKLAEQAERYDGGLLYFYLL